MEMDLSKINLPSLDEIEFEIDRQVSKESFAEFAKRAWHVIEPATNLKWGWAMQAICDHLQAVTEGKIQFLVMNVPPGTSKSTLASVLWPAWEMGPREMPYRKYLSTSHSKDLAIRDNVKCRNLMQSEWFQKRWPIIFSSAQNTKEKFETKNFGFRQAAAFTKMTGIRGDRIILDDPLAVHSGNSEADLLDAELAFRETLPSRVTDDKAAIVIIMQRIHSRDTTGLILDLGLPYDLLCIPMLYEPERKCKTSIGWEDPRTEPGELMFPERFPKEQVDSLEETLGSYAFAGQYQQNPVPREGGLFNFSWFENKSIPAGTEKVVTWVRGWDLAATVNQRSDWTVGVKLGFTKEKKVIIGDVVRRKLTSQGVRLLIKQTALIDGPSCFISLPKEPGAAGQAWKDQLIKDLHGYVAYFTPDTGDKATRAQPFAAQVEAGNVYFYEAPWNQDYIAELCIFPGGKFDDMVDASTRAYAEILRKTKRPGVGVSTFGAKIF